MNCATCVQRNNAQQFQSISRSRDTKGKMSKTYQKWKKQGNQYVPMLQGGSIQICLHIHKIILDEYIKKLSSKAMCGRLHFIVCPSALLGYFHKYELLLKSRDFFKTSLKLKSNSQLC